MSDDITLCPFDLVPARISDAARVTLTNIVKDTMKTVFGGFGPPPSIHVSLLGDKDLHKWDEIFEEYEEND